MLLKHQEILHKNCTFIKKKIIWASPKAHELKKLTAEKGQRSGKTH